MTSLVARLGAGALTVLARPVLGPPVPLSVQRAYLEALAGPPPRGTQVHTGLLGSRTAEVVTARGSEAGRPVLLVHGGAFVTCSPRTHRAFAGHLSAATGSPVHVLDYRLAPEHPHPAALDDTVAALEVLAARGPVDLVGDSAGGWLALAAVLRQRAGGGAQPRRLALVSPLVDSTLASALAWSGRDPLLRRDWVRTGVGEYRGRGELPDLLADLETNGAAGLPPTLVHVSEHERLRPEGEDLARRLGADLELLPGVWHDVHLQAGVVPEATAAVRALGTWLRAA